MMKNSGCSGCLLSLALIILAPFMFLYELLKACT